MSKRNKRRRVPVLPVLPVLPPWQIGDKGIATSGKNAYYAVVTMLGPLDGMVCVDISYPDAISGKMIVVPNELPACNLRRPLPEERAG